MEEVFVALFFLVCFAMYFLPTIIAIIRKNNIASVLLINLFLGWSVIGYFLALGLAIYNTKHSKVIVNNSIIVNSEKNAKINQKSEPEQKTINKQLTKKNKKNLTKKQKDFLIVSCGVLGSIILILVFGRTLDDKVFYMQLQEYEQNSKMFKELFDCENLKDEEYREEVCTCLYEFSVKKEQEYYLQKEKIQKTKYEYSYQKDKDLNKLKEAYQTEAISICEDIIN